MKCLLLFCLLCKNDIFAGFFRLPFFARFKCSQRAGSLHDDLMAFIKRCDNLLLASLVPFLNQQLSTFILCNHLLETSISKWYQNDNRRLTYV